MEVPQKNQASLSSEKQINQKGREKKNDLEFNYKVIWGAGMKGVRQQLLFNRWIFHNCQKKLSMQFCNIL